MPVRAAIPFPNPLPINPSGLLRRIVAPQARKFCRWDCRPILIAALCIIRWLYRVPVAQSEFASELAVLVGAGAASTIHAISAISLSAGVRVGTGASSRYGVSPFTIGKYLFAGAC